MPWTTSPPRFGGGRDSRKEGLPCSINPEGYYVFRPGLVSGLNSVLGIDLKLCAQSLTGQMWHGNLDEPYDEEG